MMGARMHRLLFTAQPGLPVEGLARMVQSLLALSADACRVWTGGKSAPHALRIHWGLTGESGADIVLPPTAGLADAANALLESLSVTLLDGEFAVIGSPIAHSLSPFLHARVFDSLGMAARYQAAHVSMRTLPAFIDYARGKLRGFNVTHPLKEAILPYLDDIAQDARMAGAVNTVIVSGDGRLHGYNTDMQGLDDALALGGFSFRRANVLVLGAGGAARSACVQAARAGARGITVLARDAARARALCETLDTSPGTQLAFDGMRPLDIAAHAARADLLLQCTPLGMTGVDADFEQLDFLQALPEHALVFDMVYQPEVTRLLHAARDMGLATQNGLDMLIAQAISADALFSGMALDIPSLHGMARAAVASHLRLWKEKTQ